MEISSLKPSFSGKQIVYFCFSCIVSLAVFTYIFSTVSFREVITLIENISLIWVFVFIFFSFAMSFFRTWRYLLVLKVSGYQPNQYAVFLITLVRNFFSDLLPARLGTLVYIYLVQTRLGIPFGPAASSFSFAFIYDIIALSFLVFIAVVLGVSAETPTLIILVSAATLAVLSIVVLITLPTLLTYLCRLLEYLPNTLKPTQLTQGLIAMRSNLLTASKKNIQLQLLVLSLGVRCCKYLALYFLVLALVLPLGYSVVDFPLATVFLGLCSAEIAASLPISGIAGFGIYEGTWSLVFQLLGYPERVSVLTSISHHLLTQIYGYLLGAVALLILILPVFRYKNQTSPMQKHDTTHFWRKFTISIICIAAVTFLLLSQQSLYSKQPGKAPSAGKNSTLSLADDSLLQSLSARVVYQRPDGLYIKKIGNNIPTKLSNSGSHPRWSPDGKQIAYVDNNKIMLITRIGQDPIQLATADRSKAVSFRPHGKSVLFSDGKYLREVDIQSGKITTLLEDMAVKEIDTSANLSRLTMTIRSGLGYRVIALDTASGDLRTVAKGCSASLSPDGKLVTVNDKNHTKLNIYNWKTLKKVGYISSPTDLKFDNQFWSNHPEWLVSTSEGRSKEIFIHHRSSNTSFQVTHTGDCDRADLFVSRK